jgi:hypothetical protein
VPKEQTGAVEVRVEFDSGPLAGVLRAKKEMRVKTP